MLNKKEPQTKPKPTKTNKQKPKNSTKATYNQANPQKILKY